MPCGHTNIPPPKLRISLPEASKWCTGLALVPRHPGAVPGEQRSVAHTERPSRSIARPLEPPHGRCSEVNCAQSRTMWYGFVPLLTGGTLLVCGVPPRCACVRTRGPSRAADTTTTSPADQILATPEACMGALLPCRGPYFQL